MTNTKMLGKRIKVTVSSLFDKKEIQANAPTDLWQVPFNVFSYHGSNVNLFNLQSKTGSRIILTQLKNRWRENSGN